MILYLFDIDGTLLLSGGAGSRALDRVFADLHGLEGAMDAIRPGGKTDPLILEEVFVTRLGRRPTAAEIEEILARYVPLLERELAESAGFHLMPAVVETLDFLSTAGAVLLGLATGNVRAAARAKLERADLWHRFALGGFGCDHRDRHRLVARAVERAAEHAPRPEQVVVVGDTPFDVSAAHACGATAIAVATGSVSRSELEATGADVVFDTLAELPAWHAVAAARGPALDAAAARGQALDAAAELEPAVPVDRGEPP